MSVPVVITFHGVEGSAALREDIVKHANKLGKIAHDIVSCQVVVERASQRHARGNPYTVHARLVLSDREFEAGYGVREDKRSQDPFVAVNETFDALRRQVADHVDESRSAVRSSGLPLTQ